jgi:hypothetical protein
VVTLTDPPADLRPGLSSTAKITTATRNSVLSIPIQALTVRTQADLVPTNKGKRRRRSGHDRSGRRIQTKGRSPGRVRDPQQES